MPQPCKTRDVLKVGDLAAASAPTHSAKICQVAKAMCAKEMSLTDNGLIVSFANLTQKANNYLHYLLLSIYNLLFTIY